MYFLVIRNANSVRKRAQVICTIIFLNLINHGFNSYKYDTLYRCITMIFTTFKFMNIHLKWKKKGERGREKGVLHIYVHDLVPSVLIIIYI